MNDDELRAIRRELRKIRDGVEAIAALIAVMSVLAFCFSGWIWPVPEGWAKAGPIGAALWVGYMVTSGIRKIGD